MRVLWACLLLAAATFLPSTVHAAVRNSDRHLPSYPIPTHHASAAVRHLAFAHHLPPMLDLPAQTVASSVNPPSASHPFSLVSYAVHSVLGLFSHPAQ